MSMDHALPASYLTAPADSPFIEGTHLQYAWDSVSLSSILSCPRRYYYQIICGFVPNNPNYAIALVFGIQFHKAMEWYEKAKAQGFDHETSVRISLSELCNSKATDTLPREAQITEMKEAHDEDEDDGITLRNSRIRTPYYLFRAAVWYWEQYREDPCQTYILPSGEAAVELSFRTPLPVELGGHPVLLCGHIDRVCSFNDRLFVSDYKTTKSLTRQFFDNFKLSHQLTGYTLAGQTILAEPVAGAIIDGVALQVGATKFGRGFVHKTPGEVKEYIRTVSYALEVAERCHEENFYPQNTSACYFCDFKSVCAEPPERRDNYLRRDWQQKPGWNPLENR